MCRLSNDGYRTEDYFFTEPSNFMYMNLDTDQNCQGIGLELQHLLKNELDNVRYFTKDDPYANFHAYGTCDGVIRVDNVERVIFDPERVVIPMQVKGKTKPVSCQSLEIERVGATRIVFAAPIIHRDFSFKSYAGTVLREDDSIWCDEFEEDFYSHYEQFIKEECNKHD